MLAEAFQGLVSGGPLGLFILRQWRGDLGAAQSPGFFLLGYFTLPPALQA